MCRLTKLFLKPTLQIPQFNQKLQDKNVVLERKLRLKNSKSKFLKSNWANTLRKSNMRQK